jgi:hypothetical protein
LREGQGRRHNVNALKRQSIEATMVS